MLELAIFCGFTAGLLLIIGPCTSRFGRLGLGATATLAMAWLLTVISVAYVPTEADARGDLDGLGAVSYVLFNWCFGILYGGATLIACWRARCWLVQRI